MTELKVEWVPENSIYPTKLTNSLVKVPVVRLAQVDELIAEAVLFAENVTRNGRWQPDEWEKAQAFLASPLVAAWRTRQEGKS